MAWYRNGGVVLKRVEFGGVATSEDCCCDDVTPPVGDCCCPQFENCTQSSWQIVFSQGLVGSGQVDQFDDGSNCIRWNTTIATDAGGDCAGDIADLDVVIRCPVGGGTGAADLIIEITSGGAACAVGTLTVTNRTCGAPAKIEGNFDITEILPECQCIGATVFFVATFDENCVPPPLMAASAPKAAEPKSKTGRRAKQRGRKTTRQPPKPPPLRQFVKDLPPEALKDPDVRRWLDQQEPPE